MSGFWFGILFLLFLDRTVPHLHMNSSKAEGPQSSLQKTTMLVLAVTLHNLPEGMAVGVVYERRTGDIKTVLNEDIEKLELFWPITCQTLYAIWWGRQSFLFTC